jgi:hypothetical protein
MKNIHLLRAYKEQHSIVRKNTGLLLIQTPRKEYSGTKLNIYITSDEEIKESDSYLDITDNTIWRNEADESMSKTLFPECKKIIITTDQDLIKDGVQAIDDEFLEWFIKNPSCEGVEVDKNWNYPLDKSWEYKIIIPQEEPKQESYICPHTKIQCDDECCVSAEDCHITSFLDSGIVEPKQETLEEAASRLLYSKYPYHPPRDSGYWKDMFISGANYQAERMYSEEEVIELLCDFFDDHVNCQNANISQWFEKCKKK